MLELSKTKKEIFVISDQIGSPTNAADLAHAILAILPKIKNNDVEIFHYSNEGQCSWYDFAKAIFEIRKINIRVNPILSKNYDTIVKRPHYSVLNKDLIKARYLIKIKHWRDSLIRCIKE